MFYLTKKADYGLELMMELARRFSNKPLSLRELAEEKQLPLKFLEQVAGILKKSGLVKAKEGRGGGYFLAKPAGKISLGEIIKATEGKWLNCDDCQRADVCSPKNLWRNLEKAIWQTLRKMTLEEIYVTKGGEK